MSNWRRPNRFCKAPWPSTSTRPAEFTWLNFLNTTSTRITSHTASAASAFGGYRWQRSLRQEHALCAERPERHGRRLLGWRSIRRVGARSHLFEGHRRRWQGRRQTSCLHGVRQGSGGRIDHELVSVGARQSFHVSTNNAGGNVARAGRSDAKTVSVRGHGFLFNPRDESFELTGCGGQHGMSMDDWGRTYVCANSDPFELIMYDSRYLARNPYLAAPAAAVNIAPAGKFTKLFRVSSVEPWRALRTRLRTQGIVPGSDEGGSPSGFFTGQPASPSIAVTRSRPSTTATCSSATFPTTSFIARGPWQRACS